MAFLARATCSSSKAGLKFSNARSLRVAPDSAPQVPAPVERSGVVASPARVRRVRRPRGPEAEACSDKCRVALSRRRRGLVLEARDRAVEEALGDGADRMRSSASLRSASSMGASSPTGAPRDCSSRRPGSPHAQAREFVRTLPVTHRRADAASAPGGGNWGDMREVISTNCLPMKLRWIAQTT
jgi:hypothetical protein